jgi:capsule polysaccharide export protein KpsE/RkpR
MAATLDQVLAAVNTASRKIDTLISEMGIVMSLQDDLAAATATLQTETASLIDSNTKLEAILQQLKQANVDPAIVSAFDAALNQHKASVDSISALANPPTPPAP